MKNILPVITLYQPWATWIMWGWKTIETRTHPRFECLKDRTVLIHAGQKRDTSDLIWKSDWISTAQVLETPGKLPQMAILGSVYFNEFGILNYSHSKAAMIDCYKTTRYGLFVSDKEEFKEPIPCKGQMGIWYYDIDKKEAVKKSSFEEPKILNI